MAPKALILIEGHRSIGPLYVRAAQRRGPYPITMSTPPTQYAYLAAEGVEAVQVDTNALDAMKSVYSRFNHSTHTASARFLAPDRDGMPEGIEGASRATAIPSVAEVKMYVHPNTPIVRKGDYRDLIGHVIAASPTCDQTAVLLQQAVDLVSWTITPSPKD